MPKIQTIRLACLNPSAQCRFYCDILGMKLFDDGCVGYGGCQANLSFIQADKAYAPTSYDLYWKIALAVPNIEQAYHQLLHHGVRVATPRQFRDIGYLTHFNDPEGFTIELIDHHFKNDARETVSNRQLLGGGAHLNLLTLRSVDIEKVHALCAQYSMKLLSIQPVESHDFTLYFYAFTDDVPQSNTLYALENRTWLYQQPYTILEVQHLHKARTIKTPNENQAGYRGTLFSALSKNTFNSELLIETRTMTRQEQSAQ